MAIKKRFPYRAALVACNGGCRAAGSEDGGCKDGCIGCGACIEKCKFGAISMNEYGVAEVDEEKCIACGQCAKVCPQNLIKIHDCANYIVVKCSNKEKGAVARKQYVSILSFFAGNNLLPPINRTLFLRFLNIICPHLL